jgi:hypothetical protein
MLRRAALARAMPRAGAVRECISQASAATDVYSCIHRIAAGSRPTCRRSVRLATPDRQRDHRRPVGGRRQGAPMARRTLSALNGPGKDGLSITNILQTCNVYCNAR